MRNKHRCDEPVREFGHRQAVDRKTVSRAAHRRPSRHFPKRNTLREQTRQELRVGDIKNHRLLYFKGFLFLGTGVVSSILLIAFAPSLRIAALLAIAIWSFCRFYYFAFYVIEHYIDPGHRYAGLTDFFKYAIRNRFGASEVLKDD